MTTRILVPLLGCLGFLISAIAQAQTDDGQLLRNLDWRVIGPAVTGGRIDDIAVVERRPSTIYVGAASGGLLKTTNNGTTWEPIFDNQGVASIGDVAVSQVDPAIVWVGTGEPNNRQSSTFGDGVYKSIDGGRTWQHVGLRDTHHIGRVVIDPVDPSIVYVAALGHLWGRNKERGVFKTVDGGRTWTHALALNEDTGVVDVAMHPGNRQVLYAGAYQRRRTAWGFNGGGPHGGVYRTTDGGNTWKKLEGGLPAGIVGRIGLDVCRSRPDVVYAIVEHRTAGGVYRSDDAGESWRRINDLNPRPMYYSQIRCDPNNDQRVYVLGTGFYVSVDAGKTFADPKTGQPGENSSMKPRFDVGVHVDHHALWIDPTDSDRLILGNDGGLYFSSDGSISWAKVDTIPLGQFYAIGVDMRKPYYIYGGLQDTHAWGGPSATRYYSGITNAEWFQVAFGDGMYAQIDPTDPDSLYVEQNDGNLIRFSLITGDRKNIEPYPPPGERPYRFNWTAPLQVSPHDPRTVYFGGNRLFISTDRGETWTASPDLTKAEDRDKLPIMGELPSAETLSRHDGVSAWGTVSTLAESPVARGVIWVGTDDGNLQVSRDAGTRWVDVAARVPGLPSRSYVSRVESSHADAGTAYAAFDRHRDDDFAPYIYRTTDFGQSWVAVVADLPRTGWVNVVREHPKNPKLLFAGTETGAFFSLNGGLRWTRLPKLPTVPVDDIVIHPRDNDLILGTHGRSLYVLDDITPLSDLTETVLNADAHLFDPRPATTFLLWKRDTYSGQQYFIGPNPPYGAIFNYYLRTAVPEGVKIAILDEQQKPVRELTGPGRLGINRVVWDLRVAVSERVRQADATARGPLALPGGYLVTLSVGGRQMVKRLRVDADPELPMSEAERQSRFTFLVSLNELRTVIHDARARATELSVQVSELTGNLERKAPQVPPTVPSAASAIDQEVRGIRAKLGGTAGQAEARSSLQARLNRLFGEIDGETDDVRQGSLTGPTAAQKRRLDELSRELQAILADLRRLTRAFKELRAQQPSI